MEPSLNDGKEFLEKMILYDTLERVFEGKCVVEQVLYRIGKVCMKTVFTKNLAKCSLAVFSVALISGCNWFKSGENADVKTEKKEDKVLCSLNGKPVIKESEFTGNLTQMLQSNPYFRGAGVDALPLVIKKKFFDEMVKQRLIIADAEAQNITKDAEFIKAYKDMKKLVKDSLLVQFREKKLFESIKVDDADVQKNFDENKERYIKVAGGIAVSGVKFDKAVAADAFLAKAKAQAGSFDALAKAELGGKFNDFGRVNKGANNPGMAADTVPAPVKEAVFAISKLPGVTKVKMGNDFWVIGASDKKEPVYFELKEIKPQIENMIKSNKFKESLEKLLVDLKVKYPMTIDETYFKDKEKPAEEAAPAEEAKAAAPATAA